MEKLLIARPWNFDHRSGDSGQRGGGTAVTIYQAPPEPNFTLDDKETNQYVSFMSEAHRRKKNPELVRAQLLESAVELAMEHRPLAEAAIKLVAVRRAVQGLLTWQFPTSGEVGAR